MPLSNSLSFSHLLCRFAAGSGAGGGPFSPEQEQQLEAALVEAVMAGGGQAKSSSSGGSGGGTQAAAAWPLGQLAARAAAARATAAAAAAATAAAAAAMQGGNGDSSASGSDSGGGSQAEAEAEAELRGLQLEARDAVQALLGRMRELSAFRRSLLTAQQGQQLGRLAALGQDGAPRPTPLLRQLVGERGCCVGC